MRLPVCVTLTCVYSPTLEFEMLRSRENLFHNLGLKEALQRAAPEEAPTKALREVDHLIKRVGIGILDCVERRYETYKKSPTPTNAKQYCLWRLRLHRKLNNDREVLDAINEARGLGLYDEGPGPLCWSYDFDD